MGDFCVFVTGDRSVSNGRRDSKQYKRRDINTNFDKSEEIEWQVVWQDKIGTPSVESGNPEWIWWIVTIPYWIYTAYDIGDSLENGDYVGATVAAIPE